MSTKLLAGEQIDSQTLYEQQKARRAATRFLPGPTIVAAGLQTPENIGSVLRLADAAGCPEVMFVNSAIQHPTRIRRTARNTDALVKWKFCSEEQVLEQFAAFEPLIAIELTTASMNIFETRLPVKCTFVIGSEKHGISPRILAQCQRAVHIPMYGVNGSMNVTHELAVELFYFLLIV